LANGASAPFGNFIEAALAAQCRSARRDARRETVAFMEEVMNGIIYLVGLIVIIMAILSFLGLR
jgi:predicted membrane channel-forming protein YqfA (hemolysin III family)